MKAGWPSLLPAGMAEEVRRALAAAGVPVPADDDTGFTGRIVVAYLPRGLGVLEIVWEERTYHQTYSGMCEDEDDLQAERQRRAMGRGVTPRPWASSAAMDRLKGLERTAEATAVTPSAEVLTRLVKEMVAPVLTADIERACRHALENGWTRHEVGRVLKVARATYANEQILDCPEETRAALIVALTTIKFRMAA